MVHFLKRHWAPLIIATIALLLCITNYTPGTYFSGWDTLHPEFNFGLNFQRLIDGVFRQEQGLGAVAGHSHMADLPRVILLYIFHFFLPQSFLRYSYFFLNLIIGPLGVYSFLRRLVFSANKQKGHEQNQLEQEVPAFLGGLFYLLNLGTMQQFFVAFEMFTTLYAFLPWLLLFATEYLFAPKIKKRKLLLLFSSITLLATPMSYAATLWYVYFLLFFVYLASLILAHSLSGGNRFAEHHVSLRKFNLLQRGCMLLLLTILLNAFWLLPNLYFILTHGKSVADAYTNQLFSPQAFLYNKEFGTLPNLLLLKSFLFDWSVYGKNGFTDLLGPWITYLQQPLVLAIGSMIAGITIIGLIHGLAKRLLIALAVIPMFVITVFFLINANGPSGLFYTFLKNVVPLFQEAMRFPQDKFYIHYIFLYSMFFSLGTATALRICTKFFAFFSLSRTLCATLFACCISIALLTSMFPAFQGQLISPYMRVKIPQEYFELFDYMNKQQDARRISTLPIASFWGWEYYDWYGKTFPSFQGAGFVWFGMKQPVLERDFDRWTPFNQQYYNQMASAIYKDNPQLLRDTLEKYDMGYILIDTSIISPGSNPHVLFQEETATLLGKQPYLDKPHIFGKHIYVYHVKIHPAAPVYTLTNPARVSPQAGVLTTDAASETYDHYITDSSATDSVVYPLRNMVAQDGRISSRFFSKTENGILFHLPNPPVTNQNSLLLSYLTTEQTIPSKVFIEKNGTDLKVLFFPQSPFQKTLIQPAPLAAHITLPKQKNSFLLSINQKDVFSLTNIPDKTRQSVGTVSLFLNTPNTLALYPTIPDQSIQPDFAHMQTALQPCEQIHEGQIYGMSVSANGQSITLQGRQTALCLVISLSDLLKQFPSLASDQFLLTTAFSTNQTIDPNNHVSSSVCIAVLQNGNCINYVKKNLQKTSDVLQTTAFDLQTKDIPQRSLRIFFDTTKTNTLSTVSYNSIRISLTKPLYATSFSQQTLLQSIAAIQQKNQPTNTIFIPFAGNPDETNLIDLPRTSGLCENSPLVAAIHQEKQVFTTSQNYFRYSSDAGPMCDHFSYQNLIPNQAYMLFVTSRNLTGLPLTLCVTNDDSKRCDTYARLSESKTFTTDTFLIPPLLNRENGYDINISNLGIRGTPAVNDLQAVQLVPIPYLWMNQIAILPKQTLSQNFLHPAITDMNGTTTVTSITQPGVTSVTMLPLSYEGGWRAFEVNNTFEELFPFFGTPLTNHVLVDNWANGWILPNSQSTTHDQRLIIIFLPQYLETAGFLLLLASAWYLTFPFIKTFLYQLRNK